jgi:hypothetical protein
MITLKIILAHLIGDFLLQPTHWVNHKNKYLLKSKFLYLHILIHIVLLFLVLEAKHFDIIFIITSSHLLIDSIKLYIQKKYSDKERLWFFLDQFFHIISIISVGIVIKEVSLIQIKEFLLQTKVLIIMTGFVFISNPVGIMIGKLLSKWKDALYNDEVNDIQSLAQAGKYIGWIERWLVIIFILLGRFEAIGFLITAKSVFRFSDIKNANSHKLTEYFLIGTLLSFFIAIVVGLILKYFISIKDLLLNS